MTGKHSRRKADLKVVLVGDESVGKTCLVVRYIERQFQNSMSTIGASFVLKSWGFYNIAIWDTAGGERYSGLTTFYYRNASAAILVFDMCDRRTFDNLKQRCIPILNNVGSALLKVIVGTKKDLLKTNKRQVSECEAIQLAKRVNPELDPSTGFVPYFETSSKNGLNVDKLFEYIFQHFYPNGGSRPNRLRKEDSSVSLYDDGIETKSCCSGF